MLEDNSFELLGYNQTWISNILEDVNTGEEVCTLCRKYGWYILDEMSDCDCPLVEIK